jgi:hypothetical protein
VNAPLDSTSSGPSAELHPDVAASAISRPIDSTRPPISFGTPMGRRWRLRYASNTCAVGERLYEGYNIHFTRVVLNLVFGLIALRANQLDREGTYAEIIKKTSA